MVTSDAGTTNETAAYDRVCIADRHLTVMEERA